MRILLSAFACEPNWGSETTVGWRWTEELAKQHKVTVLTHAYFREGIRAHLESTNGNPVESVEFVYYEVPGIGIHPHRLLNSQAYYQLWQFFAWWHARKLIRNQHFDLVHHLTWGTFRFSSFMGYLGIPFVYGPLGGGERGPLRLRRSLPGRAALFELVRDVNLWLSYLDPFVWLSLRNAKIIMAKTEDTKQFISAFTSASKVAVMGETGCEELREPATREVINKNRTLHLFYAGRLIGYKGVHFAISALAKIRTNGVDAVLYIAGDGSMRNYLQDLAQKLGVTDQVIFLGKLSRDELFKKSAEMDLFVFPSLRDSAANVVMEALASSLPVICLDLGGPKNAVDDSCGRVIDTRGKSEDEVITSLANEISDIFRNPTTHEKLRRGAYERAANLSWEKQIGKAYALIQLTLFQKDENE